MNDTNIIIQALEKYENFLRYKPKLSIEALKLLLEPLFSSGGYRVSVDDEDSEILIIFDGGVGDFIMFTPFLRNLKATHSHARISIMIPDFLENIVSVCPYIDEIILDNNRHKFFSLNNAFRLYLYNGILEKMLSHKYNTVYNWSIKNSDALLCYLSGAQERILCRTNIGGDNKDGNPYLIAKKLSTKVNIAIAKSKHNVDLYLSALENLFNINIINREMEVWFTNNDLEFIKDTIQTIPGRKYIAMSIGGLIQKKLWPVENYLELAKQILRHNKNTTFVIIGGKNELNASKILTNNIPSDNVCNLVGKSTFRQTAAALSLCCMYIGNDTGAMHIAAALKRPIWVAFCCPSDHKDTDITILDKVYPYHSPAVTIQPKKRLPECTNAAGAYSLWGCIQNHPHCITQITVTDMWNGYCALSNML